MCMWSVDDTTNEFGLEDIEINATLRNKKKESNKGIAM